jgi:hypothetical protein
MEFGMPTPDNIIHLPKLNAKAYDPDRPLSRNLLIQAQVRHFAEANKQLPDELKVRTPILLIRTEGQASQYIRKVTEAIHKSGGLAEVVRKAT